MIDVNHVKLDACQTKIKYVFYESFPSDVKLETEYATTSIISYLFTSIEFCIRSSECERGYTLF